MSFQQLFATSADESINLFELIQCAALNDLLPSVALHLLQLSSLNWNYHEPIITASTLLIESNYLSQWNSSLCESFYGLKRVYVGSRRWFFGVSLLELVALPALRRYASGKYSSLNSSLLLENPSRAPISSSVPLSDTETIQSSTRLNPSLSQIQVSQTLRKKLQRLFVYLYPAISALDSLSIFLFRIIYMFKLLSYTSPFHLFFNIKLRRITMEDIRNQAVLESAQDVLQQRIMANSNGLKYLMCWIKRMGVVGVRWSKGALPIALAVFRFHQCSSDLAKTSTPKCQAPPSAPPILALQPRVGHCAICQSLWANPAMVGSGYVFCYTCLFSQVKEFGRCPVSGMYVDVSDIRKIYL